MQWHMKSGNIIISLKVKIYFTLYALITKKIVAWYCHLGGSAKGRYDMILSGYILLALVLNLNIFYHVIKADDGPLKGLTVPVVYLGTYEFKTLNTGKITP